MVLVTGRDVLHPLAVGADHAYAVGIRAVVLPGEGDRLAVGRERGLLLVDLRGLREVGLLAGLRVENPDIRHGALRLLEGDQAVLAGKGCEGGRGEDEEGCGCGGEGEELANGHVGDPKWARRPDQ